MRTIIAVDPASPDGDKSMKVIAQRNPDGTLTILNVKEVDPSITELELQATDITDQKHLPKPGEM
jgi:hypothetical protein